MRHGGPVLAAAGALMLTFWAGGPGPAHAQLLHRDRCSSITCAESLFQLELRRMVLTEGALASDRDARDLRFLRRRIRSELEQRPGDSFLWLALAEAELGLGDALPALRAATRGLAAGADSALAMRSQAAARLRVMGGERDGAEHYLAALARMSRASAPRFLADLLPMLTQDELDWWLSSDVERLREWTRDYWEHRAALAGVTVEERLAEHMRRSAVAARMFAPPGTGSGAAGNGDVLRQPELRVLPYDDRGLVYIRRGPPLDELRVSSDIFSGLPATTWLYAGVDGSVDAFHFAKSLESGSGFRIVVAPSCDLDYVGSGMSSTPVSVSRGWVLGNAGLSADVTRAAVSCFSGDAHARRANAYMNALAMRQATARALATESPRAPFRTAVPAYYDFFMFRGADGATEVVTPVVIPIDNGIQEPVHVLVTFADQTGGVVRREATSSSVRTEVQPSIASAGETWGVAYVRTLVEPTDRAAYRVVVRDPGSADAGSMWGGNLSVRSFAGVTPTMSDVVVTGSGPSTWSRGSTRLFLLPARSFAPGAAAALFYELYDMQPGTTYRTELTLRRMDEGIGERLWRALTGAGQVRLRFDAQVPQDAGATLQELRSVELPSEEGRYALTVTVTTATGAVAQATRDIVIARDAATPSGGPGDAARDEATEQRERN
ncbi:MAG TPA: hypothetical protein VMN78_09455 [Longimicrobiales bacterium]|nr:hypothetical protein [Longimicrobiales bacterium]